MGDRGGTATAIPCKPLCPYYTRWEIGGEPQLDALFPGDTLHYTRWEIGGEPQLVGRPAHRRSIIPDGRSGGNRNYWRARVLAG